MSGWFHCIVVVIRISLNSQLEPVTAEEHGLNEIELLGCLIMCLKEVFILNHSNGCNRWFV